MKMRLICRFDVFWTSPLSSPRLPCIGAFWQLGLALEAASPDSQLAAVCHFQAAGASYTGDSWPASSRLASTSRASYSFHPGKQGQLLLLLLGQAASQTSRHQGQLDSRNLGQLMPVLECNPGQLSSVASHRRKTHFAQLAQLLDVLCVARQMPSSAKMASLMTQHITTKAIPHTTLITMSSFLLCLMFRMFGFSLHLELYQPSRICQATQ